MINNLNIIRYEIKAFLLIAALVVVVIFFAAMEEYEVLVAGTASNSVNVSVSVLDTISISSPVDVTMSPDIAGTGSSTGDVIWNVTTNINSGWKLEVNASQTPAMQSGGNSFADYTEAVGGTPETWSVGAADSEFGFSADGTKSETKYSNGTKFEGFEGSTKIQVASDSVQTGGGGVETTVKFKAEVGSSHTQASGTYTATITATASTL